MIRLLAATLSIAVTGAASAQGLSGPSSVEADLKPGDGLTDPQYRSDFPRNIAPGWFEWKDRLAEGGFRFNIDYLVLGQTTNADLGTGEAASGIARFYGNRQATERGPDIQNRRPAKLYRSRPAVSWVGWWSAFNYGNSLQR